MEATGLVYDIQRYAVHDGPGIRTTVFLKGCPLSCPWCHSPESQSFEPQVCFRTANCLGTASCGSCLTVCPRGALTANVGGAASRGICELDVAAAENGNGLRGQRAPARLDRDLCDDCGRCADACRTKALYVCGRRLSAEEALAQVAKDRRFYETSGGGVTLSGGEPLAQLPFARAFLEACRQAGLSTALDTTGFAPASAIRQVLPFTDLFLYDIKHMSSRLHRRVVGVPNEGILDNARAIARQGGALQMRIPLIPRFNDSHDNMEQTARFCAELGSAVQRVQLLPYHALGLAKYERLQWKGPVFEAPPMKDEAAETLAEPFEKRGIDVVIH